MIWIISAEALLAIMAFVVLCICAFGVVIVGFFKTIIFLIIALISIGTIICLFGSICNSLSDNILAVLPLTLNLLAIVWVMGFPEKISKYTAYDNSNMYLWWGLLLAGLNIIAYYFTSCVEDGTALKGTVVLLTMLLFGFVAFVRLWLMGAEYYDYAESDKLGAPVSYIVEADEVSLYKNTKKYEEDNKVLGVYPKGTILEVKKPFIIGKMADGYWLKTKKPGTIWQRIFESDSNSSLKYFWGEFVAPDGKKGYVAVYNDEMEKDCLAIYEQPTKAEAYQNCHSSFTNTVSRYLYNKFDLFHYRSYVEPEKTEI